MVSERQQEPAPGPPFSHCSPAPALHTPNPTDCPELAPRRHTRRLQGPRQCPTRHAEVESPPQAGRTSPGRRPSSFARPRASVHRSPRGQEGLAAPPRRTTPIRGRGAERRGFTCRWWQLGRAPCLRIRDVHGRHSTTGTSTASLRARPPPNTAPAMSQPPPLAPATSAPIGCAPRPSAAAPRAARRPSLPWRGKSPPRPGPAPHTPAAPTRAEPRSPRTGRRPGLSPSLLQGSTSHTSMCQGALLSFRVRAGPACSASKR